MFSSWRQQSVLAYETVQHFQDAIPGMIEIEGSLLDQLVPINELNEENRRQLADKAKVAEISPASTLSAVDEHRWIVYLVEGSIRRLSSSGEYEKISAGSEQARQPLFDGARPGGPVVAESTSVIVRFDKQLFEVLTDNERSSGYQVVDIHTVVTENKIVQQVFRAVSKQELELPTMPELAASMRDSMRDPMSGSADLVKLIKTDAHTTEAIVDIANSDLYPHIGEVRGIDQAVARLQPATAGTLATALNMIRIFEAPYVRTQQRMGELRQHASQIGALSFELARKVAGLKPERAMLAGVVCDIGAAPILGLTEKLDLETDLPTIDSAIVALRSLVGAMLANRWRLDTELEQVVEHAEEWYRDETPQPDYCDVVVIAKLLVYQTTRRAKALPPLEEVPAFRKLELSVHDDESLFCVSAPAVEAIRRFLDGGVHDTETNHRPTTSV